MVESPRVQGKAGLGKFLIVNELLEGVFYEFGNYFAEDGTGGLKTGICVDLYQPDVVVRVDHEI